MQAGRVPGDGCQSATLGQLRFRTLASGRQEILNFYVKIVIIVRENIYIYILDSYPFFFSFFECR